jgi:hypothetical protein
MRRGRNDRVAKIVLLAGILSVAAAAVAVASATLASGGGSPDKAVPGKPTRATIMPADTSPLRLRGARFKPGERVRVTVNGEERATKSVKATASGAFVVSFAGLSACDLTVVATGDKGSRASFQLSSIRCD